MPDVTAPKRIPVSKGQLLINGKWCAARDEATTDTTDPTTEEVITSVAKAGPADAQAAIDAAYKANMAPSHGLRRSEKLWPSPRLTPPTRTLLLRLAALPKEPFFGIAPIP